MDELLMIDGLIDNGSSLVLISQELANQLGLRKCTLWALVSVSVALSNRQKQQFSLSQFVNLCVSSLDSVFQACTVCTLILPGLCTPLLLELLFLQHNRIVIDHNCCSCIAKGLMYNLLHGPTVINHVLSKPLSHGEHHDLKKGLQNELKATLPK